MRKNKSNVCPTLTANLGTGGHNVPLIFTKQGIRKLTPRECFNLQGFPSNFKLPSLANCHLYKQAGNSVIVPLVKRIAENILIILEERVAKNFFLKERTKEKLFSNSKNLQKVSENALIS